ncbi:MAG TPA: PilX N-terminal domain-containing pilus assembly protein [Nevskiaceae bacterium]|nr:PilX N-terminal domain-containing pilus assembly protein [Nevskiaceae bacterium]
MKTFRIETQRGVALAISLILLLVITLVGIMAIRLTTVQQRITANFYDREVGFQGAEASLVAAAAALDTGTTIDRDCSTTATACQTNPFTDSGFNTANIHTVATGSAAGQFTINGNATGQPQYVIENMGQWPDTDSDTGFNQSANSAQYGAQGVQGVLRTFYRVTARSGDPAAVGDRAVVTLQAMYKK